MKKILFIVICLLSINAQALFIGVHDESGQNRFLGQDVTSCDASGANAYKCGNSSVSGLLHINFLVPKMYGKQFYLFNDFIYWAGEQSRSEQYDTTALRVSASQEEEKIKKEFPAPGIYMIELGTSDYLRKIIAPEKKCPTGEYLVMAQLKYNDGNLIYAWSQDAVCVTPHDSFSLQISSDLDNSIQKSVDGVKEQPEKDGQGIDWMKNPGPSSSYIKATKSPRKIRLVKSGGSSQAASKPQPAVKAT